MPPKGTIEMTAPQPLIFDYVPHQIAKPKKPNKGLKIGSYSFKSKKR